MIKKLKKYTLILFSMFMLIAFNSSGVRAADDSVLNLGTRIITDVNKTWTITFNNAVDISSIPDNIQIKDVTTGNFLTINPVQGESKSIIKVAAPSGGYTVGHNYQISLNKNIKLANGTFLYRTSVLNFIVSSKSNSTYNIWASVTISPAVNVFKQITITSSNLPGAAKYKIEGNSKLFDIGKSMILVTSKSNVKVYIYDSAGNALGTADMDVSAAKSNMNLNLH